MLTFINLLLIWLCVLGSHIGVKMTIFGITPKVMARWNISWECSTPLKPICLFLRVNKEGLCDGTKVRGIVILEISFLWFLEWRKKRHYIINLLNTFFFQAGLCTIPHNLPLQMTWTDPLPLFTILKLWICFK